MQKLVGAFARLSSDEKDAILCGNQPGWGYGQGGEEPMRAVAAHPMQFPAIMDRHNKIAIGQDGDVLEEMTNRPRCNDLARNGSEIDVMVCCRLLCHLRPLVESARYRARVSFALCRTAM